RPRAAEPAVKLQGVAANYPTVGTIRRFPDARALIRSTPFVLVCAVPPGILVAAALGLVIARRPREARARDRALKEARSRIRAARGSLETTSSAYGDYFRERFGLPQGELDPRELDTALANEGVSEETREEARGCLDALLAARYGVGANDGSPEQIAERARAVLEAVEPAARGGRRLRGGER